MQFGILIHDILMNGIKVQPINIYKSMCNIYAGWRDNKKN